MPAKMTLKDLSIEVENLKKSNEEKNSQIKAQDEKIASLHQWAQELYSNFCTKSNESDQQHFNNAKILDKKIVEVEEKLEKAIKKQTEDTKEPFKRTVKIVGSVIKCRECGEKFEKKEILKKHVAECHPKQINCDKCPETFDQHWKLEEHAKTHSGEKPYQCNICDKSFILQWRLKKHIQGHEQRNVKFCHYYNNNKVCKFEEISGCMFKHENAPVCKNLKNCRIKKCQFSHNLINDKEADSSLETVDNLTDTSDCEMCSHTMHNERVVVNHKNENFQQCSECSYKTKCWTEYNTHWA